MRIPAFVSLRSIVLTLVAAVIVLCMVDGGSVFMTRASVPDAARNVGYAAANAAEGQPTTHRTVVLAYAAASDDAKSRNLTVSTKNFTLYKDGKVKLTASRTARTFLLRRISPWRHFADVSATVTVAALPFTSMPARKTSGTP
jgi:Flp pilus assembly protein TadG